MIGRREESEIEVACDYLCIYLAIPSNIIPKPPTTIPACNMPYGRANEPEPILALAKLKNVAISLHVCTCVCVREGGREGGRGREGEGGREGGGECAYFVWVYLYLAPSFLYVVHPSLGPAAPNPDL